ncbi:MAG: hypothetical protein CMN58_04890 [Solibacterales bacterium]|nr:hypothetical protein [Bryobacterales bacterium]
MTLFFITVAVIALAMLIMASGVMIAKRPLHGSCGGLSTVRPNGEPIDCNACPYREKFPECENRTSG